MTRFPKTSAAWLRLRRNLVLLLLLWLNRHCRADEGEMIIVRGKIWHVHAWDMSWDRGGRECISARGIAYE